VYRVTVVVEVHRLRCPDCGVRVEKIEQLPSKAPFSKRFEEMSDPGEMNGLMPAEEYQRYVKAEGSGH
jgi:hypothetical protein